VKVFFDTSVLFAALVEAHPHHSEAVAWLRRAKSGEVEFLTASHCLAELFSILSAYPAKPRISPADAWRLVQENVASAAHLVALSPADYSKTIQRISEMGLSGGVIYDALIAHAAEKVGAERLLTLNGADFRRAWPEGESIIHAP
jgi:predicted nucleic acid-binding protein